MATKTKTKSAKSRKAKIAVRDLKPKKDAKGGVSAKRLPAK